MENINICKNLHPFLIHIFKKPKGRHDSLQALKQSAGIYQAHKRKASADMPSRNSKSYRVAKKP